VRDSILVSSDGYSMASREPRCYTYTHRVIVSDTGYSVVATQHDEGRGGDKEGREGGVLHRRHYDSVACLSDFVDCRISGYKWRSAARAAVSLAGAAGHRHRSRHRIHLAA